MAMDDLSDDGVSPPTKSHRQTLIRMSVLKKRKTMANGCSA